MSPVITKSESLKEASGNSLMEARNLVFALIHLLERDYLHVEGFIPIGIKKSLVRFEKKIEDEIERRENED